MPTIQLTKSSLMPAHPDDIRRTSGYFSHIKSHSIRDCGGANDILYIPPTRGQFYNFMRRNVHENIGELTGSNYDNLFSNLINHLPLNQIFNSYLLSRISSMINNPNHRIRNGGKITTYGTEALSFLQICFNICAAVRAFRTHHPLSTPHSKVDFIWTTRGITNQEQHFHGRNVFKISYVDILHLLRFADHPASPRYFWDEIMSFYIRINRVHTMIQENGQIRTRRAQRRGGRVSTPTPIRRNIDPHIDPHINTHLSREYLDRSEEELDIPASHIAGLLLRVSPCPIDQKILNKMHEILITALVSANERSE